jgi:hypothetical protein
MKTTTNELLARKFRCETCGAPSLHQHQRPLVGSFPADCCGNEGCCHSDAPAGWTPPKDQGKTMTDAKWDDLVAQEGKLAAHRSACRAARGKGVQ